MTDPALTWPDRTEPPPFPRIRLEAGPEQTGTVATELDASGYDLYYTWPDWTNRAIIGDCGPVLAHLAAHDDLAGAVQTIYADPPYHRPERQGRGPPLAGYDQRWDTTADYLAWLHARLTVTRPLLTASGSVFVQCGPHNSHLIRTLLDEIYGADNHVVTVNARKVHRRRTARPYAAADQVHWYARNKPLLRYRRLYRPRPHVRDYSWIELEDGTRRLQTPAERNGSAARPPRSRRFARRNLFSRSTRRRYPYTIDGRTYHPPHGGGWTIDQTEMTGLHRHGRLVTGGGRVYYVDYLDDDREAALDEIWHETPAANYRRWHQVETPPLIVRRCILQTTDPGDLVLDPTSGGGTTAVTAERYARRWIAIDRSATSLHITAERIRSAQFPWYDRTGPPWQLRVETARYHPRARVADGLPALHRPHPDRPIAEPHRVRIAGPFRIEVTRPA